jgi:hypothetical protein
MTGGLAAVAEAAERLGDLALTVRVAIRSAGIAYPRILGEPFVRRPAR